MSIALIIVFGFGVSVAGGPDAVISHAKSLPGYLTMMTTYNPETGTEAAYPLINIVSMLAWGLGYFGMPHVLLRFMAIEDVKKLKLSRRVATVWVVISMFVAVFIGVVGNAMSKVGVIPTLEDPETIIIVVAGVISQHGVLAAIVAGLILAGILAATMSTADSQMLAAASSVSQNIIQDFFKVKLDEKKSLLIARITIVAISLIALFLARDPNSSVFRIVSFAWAGFGGAFGAVTLCSLFWKRCNFQGALAGMISGGVMVFVWKYLVRPLGGALDIYELLPAFLAEGRGREAASSCYLFSRIWKCRGL